MKIIFLSITVFFVLNSLHGQKNSTIVSDTTFVNLKEYSTDFIYDMRYATENNFLNAKVYDCAECYLRLKTVRALLDANQSFKKLGFKIKIFDCYRPLSIQRKMWTIVSNPSYVANPAKGSIHNRGGAVDVALVTMEGTALDFGTDFDFFGDASSHSYKKLSKSVKQNRKLLKRIMNQHGFSALPSEWWHYNFSDASKDGLSDFTWPCN